MASVSVLVAWCLGIKNRILKWIPNIYLAPIMIRLLDYPLELLPLGLKSATSISLLFTGIYLLYMTPTYIGMCFIVKSISQKIREIDFTRQLVPELKLFLHFPL